MEKHPLFSAFEQEHNKYLGMKKNQLLKLCKEKKIDADYDDEIEDLAFLLYRYEENSKMTSERIEQALSDLGIKMANNKANNLLILITYELALVDLYDAEDEELEDVAKEFSISTEGLEREDIIIETAVAMLNS